MSTLRVAAAQLVSGPDPTANLATVARYAAEAADAGAQLLVCPEATMRCFGLPLAEIAEPPDGPWARGLADIAEQYRLVLAAGMFCPAPDGRVLNVLRAVGPGVDASYLKIHLYDAYGFRESDTVAPGADPVLITVGGVPVGLTVCYDVRFPGLYTRLAELGAELICVASSWGAGPGKLDQWSVLNRARALDSTCFVLGAGQADPATIGQPGRGSAPTGVGGSLLVGPTGQVAAVLGAEPGLLVADCDTADVAAARRTLPVLANRRY